MRVAYFFLGQLLACAAVIDTEAIAKPLEGALEQQIQLLREKLADLPAFSKGIPESLDSSLAIASDIASNVEDILGAVTDFQKTGKKDYGTEAGEYMNEVVRRFGYPPLAVPRGSW